MFNNKGNALRYKAEFYRFVGYCLLTPICMKLCAILMSKGNIVKMFIRELDWQMLFSVVVAWAGYRMLNHGFNVMVELDREASL